MKSVSTLILGIAGLALGYIALSAPGADRSERPGLALDAPVPAHLKGEIPDGYVARSLDVDGMCCNGCPRKLYERLIAVDGVVDAAVSFEERSARAVVPADFDVSLLKTALDSDKYTTTPRR